MLNLVSALREVKPKGSTLQVSQGTQLSKRFKLPKWAVILLGAVFVCITIAGAVHWWVERPRYLESSIPAPDGRWWYTEYTTQTWTGGHSKYFIVRKEKWVFGNDCEDDHVAWESIVAHFDKWLTNRGWIKYGERNGTACEYLLAESRLLDHVEGSHLVFYRQRDPQDWTVAPEACLAIWPIDAEADGYIVVFVTKNPSWYTVFVDEFTHPKAR